MIILRKLFSRRDEFTSEYELPISDLVKKYCTEDDILKPYLKIESSKKYNQDINILGIEDKKVLDRLKADIKAGFLYEDGPNGGDTHFLRDFSKKGKHITFSKKISDSLRLNYTIYPIEVKEFTNPRTKERIYYPSQKIVYQSCGDHTMNGVGRYIK